MGFMLGQGRSQSTHKAVGVVVTAGKELQSAMRLAWAGPVVAYLTARTQRSGKHASLHEADTPPARAKAPRRGSIVVVGTMAQSRDRSIAVLDNAFSETSQIPLQGPHRSFCILSKLTLPSLTLSFGVLRSSARSGVNLQSQ